MTVGDFRNMVGYSEDTKQLLILCESDSFSEAREICGLYKSLSGDRIILVTSGLKGG